MYHEGIQLHNEDLNSFYSSPSITMDEIGRTYYTHRYSKCV